MPSDMVAPTPASSAATPPPGYDQFRAMSRFDCLDGLRALCILAVIFHHTPEVRFQGLGDRGYLGVDMFFIISGFLIVTLLLRERESRGRISLKQFYIRRTLRIFPVFYGLLIATSALFLLKKQSNNAEIFFGELPWIACYLTNWVPSVTMPFTWSLSAEEQFYLVWPTVERFLPPRGVLVALGAVFTCFQLANFEVFEMLGFPPLPYFSIFPPICLGVALAHVLHNRKAYTQIAPWLSKTIAAPAMILVVVLIAAIPLGIKGFSRLSVHLAMTCLLGACVIRENHPVARFLRWKPLARIGVVSYGMYLFHESVRHVVLGAYISNGPTIFGVTALLTWLVAEASFRWFETPFLNLKKRWT